MAKDKAVHYGESFFNKSHYAGSIRPRKTTSSNSNTGMEGCVKIFKGPRLLQDGSADRSTHSIPAIMWMFLLSLQKLREM